MFTCNHRRSHSNAHNSFIGVTLIDKWAKLINGDNEHASRFVGETAIFVCGSFNWDL